MIELTSENALHAINSGLHFASRLVKERKVASFQELEGPVPFNGGWAICHETPGVPFTRVIPVGASIVRPHPTETDDRSGVALAKLQMKDVSGIKYLHPGIDQDCEMEWVSDGPITQDSATGVYDYAHQTRYKFLDAHGNLDGQWLFTYVSSWEDDLPTPPKYRMHITEEVAPVSGGVLAWDDYGVIPAGASDFKFLEQSAPLPDYRHITQLYPGRYHRALSMWAREFAMWGEGRPMSNKLQGMDKFARTFKIDGNLEKPERTGSVLVIGPGALGYSLAEGLAPPEHFADLLDPIWGWHYEYFDEPGREWAWIMTPSVMYDEYILGSLPRGLAHYPYTSRASFPAFAAGYLASIWQFSPMRKALTACDLLNFKGLDGTQEAFQLLKECEFEEGKGVTRTLEVNGLVPRSVRAYKTVWLTCFGVAACQLHAYARRSVASQEILDTTRDWAQGMASVLLNIQIDDDGKYVDANVGDGLGEVYRPDQSGGFIGSYQIESGEFQFKTWTGTSLDSLESVGAILGLFSQGPGPHLMQSPAGYETTMWAIKALSMYLSEFGDAS